MSDAQARVMTAVFKRDTHALAEALIGVIHWAGQNLNWKQQVALHDLVVDELNGTRRQEPGR